MVPALTQQVLDLTQRLNLSPADTNHPPCPGELCSPELCRSPTTGQTLCTSVVSAFLAQTMHEMLKIPRWQLQGAFAGTHTQTLSHTFAFHSL